MVYNKITVNVNPVIPSNLFFTVLSVTPKVLATVEISRSFLANSAFKLPYTVITSFLFPTLDIYLQYNSYFGYCQ